MTRPNNILRRYALSLACVILAGCSAPATIPNVTSEPTIDLERPDVVATNAFYYYADVSAAWAFYRDVLGLETVVDYGFAKIMRIADSSYLTLVQASEGMHSAAEPKTVTLSIITDEFSAWKEHLVRSDVSLLATSSPEAEAVRNSIVVLDPEGYYLRFIRYNPHPNHATYVAGIATATPVRSGVKTASGPMSIRATAFTAYFDDAESVRPFYEELFDITPTGKIDGVHAYQLSSSGLLLLDDGSDGLHQPTEQSGVTFSFLTNCVDAWYDRARNWPGFEIRTPSVLDEDGLVRVFVGYDPQGTFLEWDTFAEAADNEALLRYLSLGTCNY